MPALHSLDALFLCVLLRGPNYGLGIASTLAQLHPRFRPGVGALYPALQRMQRAGWVATAKADSLPQSDARARVLYELTPKGRRLAKQLATSYRSLPVLA